MGILRRALTDAMRWGRVGRNVASLADPPTVPRPEVAVWSPIELRTFLASVEVDRLLAAWMLAITTGLRRGEVLGLRWPDVDLEAGRLSLVHGLTVVDHKLRLSAPKTNRSRRSVALDDRTVAVLRAHRARQLEERLGAGPAWQDHGLVFTREDGSPIHPERLTKMFRQRARAAGLPRIPLHGLRHSYATAALTAGVPVKVLS